MKAELFLALSGFLGFLGSGCAPETVLERVPAIDASAMEPQVAKSLESSRQAVEKDPQDASAWGLLGARFDAHHLYPEALLCYRRAHALDPSDVRYPYYAAWVGELVGAGDEEVVALYRAAGRLEAEYPPIHLRLGRALMRMGRFDEAQAAYGRALELAPDYGVAHLGLGQLLLGRGDAQAALPHLQAAVDEAPDDRPARASLVRALTLLGRADEARAVSEGARGRTFALSERDRLRDNVGELALDADACLARSRDALVRGDGKAAVLDARRALEARPDDDRVHALLGQALVQQQDFAGALAQFERLQASQLGSETHLAWGIALASSKRSEDALAHFEQAVLGAPGSASPLYSLALCLESLGHRAEATEAYRRALELDPRHPAAAPLGRMLEKPR